MGLFRRRTSGDETRSDATLASLIAATDQPLHQDFATVGTNITPERALRLASVWSCVRLLADTVSGLPVDVYRTGDPPEQVPTPPLFNRPAAGWDLPDWLYQAMVSLLLRGNAFGIITARSGSGMRPAQVELVHPDWVHVRVTTDGLVEYRYRGEVIDPADVWHVRAYTFPGSPVGLSPISYAASAIGIGLATDRFTGQYFEQGAHPTGVLTTENSITADQAHNAKAMFVQKTRGSREPVVLGNGLRFEPIQVSPEDSALVDVARFNVNEVARVFGVPPEMVGGEAGNSLTYANVEGRALDFLRYSVSPWLGRLERALGQLLPRGQYVKFNAGALLRPTTSERYAAHETALRAGFLTIDEVRALEDLPPLGIGA